MLKLLLASVLFALTYGDDKVCKLEGNILTTFSGTPENVGFGCKFHAVRDTVCGNYTVTMTLELKLMSIEGQDNKVYAVEKMYLGVKKENGDKLRCRTDRKKVSKYLAGTKTIPSNKDEGNLELTDVYEFSKDEENQEITINTKNGDFTITFRPDGSVVSFVCHSEKFTPTDFSTQMCGNETMYGAKIMKESMGFTGHRTALIPLSVFSNEEPTQTDSDCRMANSIMTTKCDGLQVDAMKYCWPIVYSAKFIECTLKWNHSPKAVFKNCVDFVCSNYTSAVACNELASHLDGCRKLEVVSAKLKTMCAADMAFA
ncbi:uncharacterized protein LOC143283338 [Babylonia areolata]|uniref:uncharacterized protein LOC143283338 n=1 Tax=Babylonia areolata TaxID=304850 RepID=UPI003FD19811